MWTREYEPYYTEDGSIGLYSYADHDVYHSKYGALTEAWEKFVIPSNLDQIFNKKSYINVLDVCYGIGYNTKALMSYTIEKNKNKFSKKIFIKKIFDKLLHNDSIHSNKLTDKTGELLIYDEAIDENKKIPCISIDCLDINEELVNLSPFFTTIKTPGEIFNSIVPEIFSCFDLYYKLRTKFIKIASKFYPKNKRDINELLDLKFESMHIDKEYKINPYVNYIIINALSNKYLDYPNKNTYEILRTKFYSRFFAKHTINYAKFNKFWGYYLSFIPFLSGFLHNIYYSTISNRDKDVRFKDASKLFKLTFYVNDARKTIKTLNKQYDCIFLDAFSYTKAPQLWSVEFIAELTKRLNDSGVIITYSNSAQVRNTFLENDLYVGKIFNEKSDKFVGTIASKDKTKIEHPLNNYEMGLCSTKAGIPYHDPNLSFSNKDIIDLREYEYRHSNLMSSSKYMKERTSKGENDEI